MEKTIDNSWAKSKTWQVALFPAYRGVLVTFVALMTFVSYAAVGGYGIATVAAGTIASACKIFDGVVDPFLAFFGDRFVTKYGRVRILLSSGFFFMALGTLILFFWGIGTNVVVYVLANLLYILGRSIFQVGGDTGNVISTKDPKQRAAMGRWGVIFSTCSTAVLSVYNSMLLLPKYGKLDMPALQELTIVVLSANAAMTLCSVLAIAEKDRPENLKLGVGKVDLKACWSLLKGNVPLRCFVVSMASDQLANQIASQSAISIMVFGIVMGNYSLRGKLSMFELVPTILFVFFASRFAGKRGMKKGLVFWTKICMLISVVMVAYMALIDTAQISSNTLLWIIFIVIDILFAASRSAVSACTNAIRPDITDYELYRSGTFMPSVMAATVTLTNEIVSSLGTTIVGIGLAAIGYVNTMPQPGDQLTGPIFWMAMLLWMGMPFFGWLCTVIAMRFYKLDKDAMAEIQRVNAERREASKNIS